MCELEGNILLLHAGQEGIPRGHRARWVHVTLLALAGSQATAAGGLGWAQSKASMEMTPGGIARQESWKPHQCAGFCLHGKKQEELRVPLPSPRRADPLFIPPEPAFY